MGIVGDCRTENPSRDDSRGWPGPFHGRTGSRDLAPVVCSVGWSSSRRSLTARRRASDTAACARVARRVAEQGLWPSPRWANRLQHVRTWREKRLELLAACRTSAGADPLCERISLSACGISAHFEAARTHLVSAASCTDGEPQHNSEPERAWIRHSCTYVRPYC